MGMIGGDELGRLFDAIAPNLVLYARQWSDRQGAEDAVQEAFLSLARQPELPQQPSAWLHQVVRNTLISAARSRKRSRDRETRSSRAEAWFSAVDDQIANIVIAQLLFLESEDPDKDIMLYINSPGGLVTAGMAIYDTMQYIRPDVATFCMGQAASMGAFLLAAGAKGKRYALPHSRIMIHQPWSGGIQGQATDIDIHAREIIKTRQTLNEILSRHTGQPIDQIASDTDRDRFMSSEDAKNYGLIDAVLEKRPVEAPVA